MTETAVDGRAGDPDDLRSLLEFLRQERGFDFTGYKRATLGRRIAKRLEAVGAEDLSTYLDLLQAEPGEFAALFDTILINVTSFFRDEPTWDRLRDQTVPELLESRRDDAPVRVWSAGCASGQEAYSAAMLLCEALGEERFRERVKIYATDVDEHALAQGRSSLYDERELKDVPAEYLDRYFEKADGHWCFRKDLRRSVIFGRNDLTVDAPISRIDLLLCRNTLMYFVAETQEQILNRLHFAVADGGTLVLGRSETLLNRGDFFRPVDLKTRIFAKQPRPRARERLTFVESPGPPEPSEPVTRLREGAIELAPVAQVAVDRAGVVRVVNEQARRLLGVVSDDVGRPLSELELSYRPVELRAAIEESYASRRRVELGEVTWQPRSGSARRLEVSVSPLVTADDEALGASITFADVTAHADTRDELQRSKEDLETAYEELQSTVEELETTNEELQSTNEELETTNEELQSTNEELETMNEELQSTNEELQTINDELRERTGELADVSGFLDSTLSSLGVGVAILDRSGVVRMWNAQAEDLWGLRPEKAEGEHLVGLDIGLPVEQLAGPLRGAMADGGERVRLALPARTRRGDDVSIGVSLVPLVVDEETRGAIVLMEDLGADGDGASVLGPAPGVDGDGTRGS